MNGAATSITLPLWAVISQWMLLLALGFFVVVAYRQLGYMLRLKDIGSDRDGLPIGAHAPPFTYQLANHDDSAGAEMPFETRGQWSLLLLADPGCGSCQTAVAGLERVAPTLHEVQILVATTAEPALIALVEQFHNATVPIGKVAHVVPEEYYRTFATPFAYIIDADGVIKAKGIAGDEASLQRLLQKADQHDIVHVGS
ncbi:MAG TPA: hypothetical protein VFN02_04080 [Ktedonobacteraceae bacterium]|nr:hypothetical protein [Ktedonobacteraceae bacterium]